MHSAYHGALVDLPPATPSLRRADTLLAARVGAPRNISHPPQGSLRTIELGNRLPPLTLRTPTASGIEEVQLDALLAGRKVVLFGVSGAFTPTCSDEHLPGFVAHAPILRESGIDAMPAWPSTSPS